MEKTKDGDDGLGDARDVMNYKMPQGPSSIDNPKSPGLHGNVYPSGSQTASIRGGESGSPGIGGSRKKSGSQR